MLAAGEKYLRSLEDGPGRQRDRSLPVLLSCTSRKSTIASINVLTVATTWGPLMPSYPPGVLCHGLKYRTVSVPPLKRDVAAKGGVTIHSDGKMIKRTQNHNKQLHLDRRRRASPKVNISRALHRTRYHKVSRLESIQYYIPTVLLYTCHTRSPIVARHILTFTSTSSSGAPQRPRDPAAPSR